jgi:rhodanese-related sulfurtransferase
MQDILQFIQHQKLLVAALLVVLILLIILEFIRQRRGGRGISPQLATKMINHRNAVVLDIRPNEAFVAGHIVGAVSLPLSELNTKLKKLDRFKSHPIIVTCPDGVQSNRAITMLQNQGFQVSFLAGGIRAWREAELPLVKGS